MMAELSLTFIVPAYNEEEGLPATLESLLAQTVPAERIIVADDFSSDRTREVGLSYGVDVVTPPENLGSKAKAQNYALAFCTTDLVLPVDADTVLSENYVELIKAPFTDPDVVIAAGCVLSKHDGTVWERGRSTEYMFGFHIYRPVENKTHSPMVCSGCCSAFRREDLAAFGGFPERTIVEDMDYTWSQQIAGKRAVYVGNAVARAADPETLLYLRKQMWRWETGFFQNVRRHWKNLIRHKPMLAVWVLVAAFEIIISPLWYLAPIIGTTVFHMSLTGTLLWFFLVEWGLMLPVLTYAAIRRKVNPLRVLRNLPFVYANKYVNIYYAWKAMVCELILVPLGLKQTFTTYEKGRADTERDETTSAGYVHAPATT
jgi:N-acetylglucosaminyltransferase